MENRPLTPSQAGQNGQLSPNAASVQSRKRSGSGGGFMSKFPFMRTSDIKSNLKEPQHLNVAQDAPTPPPRALAVISSQQQHQKTRKRKGSLRKVALLGRGAQRERRDLKQPLLTVDTTAAAAQQPLPSQPPGTAATNSGFDGQAASPPPIDAHGLGLGISDITPRPSMDGYARRTEMLTYLPALPITGSTESLNTSPTISYTSTTDEEDILSLKKHASSTVRPGLVSLSSGSESYFPSIARSSSISIQRRRSVKHAKSPLSLQGLAASPLPAAEEDHDYSETEWWGWVVLIVTWTVFTTGMGSCLGVWSWAWDVGTTPYAPPEFEDDPTLPIVGYYPSLMILTCIMAWVWVITAWVGMKYFRHAKISGD
ncbi:uncharacterized protein BCR38DRAFT_404738 [Pseudomassariella vexata]|uniref:Uncharacterized protein n=1 Tax=Pseudomassariella vexata TaxID=1141098 RepID=A0A1Y2EJE5_9PEZI|nr:uncharacterized protein BCR38DRAFT_404738 [Pseudomassariella vexata]ORY71682.1 hypothetical protein BCR38DRAFT_404738 [Pseudomassariella vexata]